MKRIMRICVNHPYWIVGFVVAVTLFFGAQIPDIRIDPRVEIVLRQNNPVEKEYVANKEKFASYADILVGMMHDDIYNPASLSKIRAIMGEAEGIRGVKKVTSILNVKNIRGMDGGLEVKPMVEEGTVPQTTEELENLRALASSWDVYKGAYITGDGKGTALAIVLNDDIETDDIVPIYYRLEEILQKYQGPEQFFISGPTVVEALQGHYMIRDLRLLVPLVLVVLLVSLFVFFRSIQGMLLPLVGVAISCIWTMGLMAMLGIPLTMVTTALPVALMAVSSAYGIHVLENVFSDASDGSCGRDGIIRALDRVRLPVIMAGLTTVASFLSLCTTPIVPITQFGLLSAFGITSALILALTFTPAVLSILDACGRVHVSHHHTRRDLVGPLLKWLERVTITNSRTILACSVVVLVVSVVGAFSVKSDLNLIEDFRKGSPIRIADEILNRNFAGTSLFNVAFQGNGEDAMKEPSVLRDMEQLQERLSGIENVGKAVSIVDFIKRMNQAMHDGDPAHYTIPDSRELIAQYLLLFSFSGGGDELDSFVNYDFSQGQILLQMKSQSGYLAQEVVDTVEGFERNDLRSDGITGILTTGLAMLAKEFNRLVVWSQVTSFVVAFVLVMLVTAVTFRSLKLGVYSMVPLIVPIIFNFGVMGMAGIKLNAATAIIASLAIGMGIDYSIHFLSRYRHEIVIANDVDRAIRIALHTSGRAIVYNALAVAAGFLVFVPSNFVILSQMGMLVALVMMTTSTAAITLLPAIVKVFPPRLVEEQPGPSVTTVKLRLVKTETPCHNRDVTSGQPQADSEQNYREVQQ
ncbi:MAG TPA: MMPL family transporter [Deltaproteobacteria bacterium]|nr:MMPL family transporter [Deltaproteobacteria bacterium]